VFRATVTVVNRTSAELAESFDLPAIPPAGEPVFHRLRAAGAKTRLADRVRAGQLFDYPQPEFLAAVASGDSPDIVVGTHDWLGNLLAHDVLEPVELPAQRRSELLPETLEAVTRDGRLWGTPYELGEQGRRVLLRSVTQATALPLFLTGHAPFLVTGPWTLRRLRRSGTSYAISAIPGFAGGPPAAPLVGVAVAYLGRAGRNRELANHADPAVGR
jgi:maltose-binding protein MalE